VAKDFLAKSGYNFPQLEKADFDQGKQQWALTFNVSLGPAKLKTVVVDEPTGQSWPLSEVGEINDFYQARDQYRSNSEHAILAGEYRKASELIWGAVTQQLKALAAKHSLVITSHRKFFDFLRQLASDLGDRSLYEEFVALNSLHQNFYDEVIPIDVFPGLYQRAIDYIGKLERLSRSGEN
jgi:Archaeal PaREP1/PaREP8 family